MRTTNLDLINAATHLYREELFGFNPEEWVDQDKNVALTNEGGDIALLEHEYPGVVTGHYFFHSRGRKAVQAGKEFLAEVFEGPYDIQVVRGLTPLRKLGARWMNKQLGFKSYGVIQTLAGPCELVILTKQEWEAKNGTTVRR